MPNFFTDNFDLEHHFNKLQLADIVARLEQNYTLAGSPVDYEEAAMFYRAALELCGQISAEFIAPRSEAIDQNGSYDKEAPYSQEMQEVYQCLGEAGFMGAIVPRQFGGMNLPATIYTMMIEMVSRANASVMTLFGYQDVAEAVAHLAPEEAAKAHLSQFVQGNTKAAMVLTEPGGGSDLQAIKVAAHQNESGEWLLNGVKHFISNGNAELLLVLAKSESDVDGIFGLSLFVVEGGPENGVSVARIEKKMGLHGSPTCELHFNNSVGVLVGKQRFGIFHTVNILNHARFSVAGQALGIAEGAFQAAYEYAHDRQAFGKYIKDIPIITELLIDMRTKLFASRELLYHGTQCLDTRNTLEQEIEHAKTLKRKVSKEDRVSLKQAQRLLDLLSPLVKYYVTETAIAVCHAAQQVFGGAGYIRGNVAERSVRDVRVTSIYEGTSQILVNMAAKSVVSDVLGDQIEQVLGDYADHPSLSTTQDKLVQLRELQLAIVASYTEIDEELRSAATKEIADVYVELFAASLLLRSAENDRARVPITERYTTNALANAQASYFRVTEQFSQGPTMAAILSYGGGPE